MFDPRQLQQAMTQPQRGPQRGPQPMLSGGYQGFQGIDPNMRAMANAMAGAQQAAGKAESEYDKQASIVKTLGSMKTAPQKSMFSALAAGIRGYATNKAMKKGAAAKAAQTAAEAKEAEYAAQMKQMEAQAEREREAALLQESRFYNETQKREERAYNEGQTTSDRLYQEGITTSDRLYQEGIAEQEYTQGRADDLADDERDFEQTKGDTLEEERVNLKTEAKMGPLTPEKQARMEALDAWAREDDNKKAAIGGNPVKGNEAMRSRQMEEFYGDQARLSNMTSAVLDYKPEYFGGAGLTKNFVGKMLDFVGADADNPNVEFAAERTKYFQNLYQTVNELLKARSGAAVTKQEFERYLKENWAASWMAGPTTAQASLEATVDALSESVARRQSQNGWTLNGEGQLIKSADPNSKPHDPNAIVKWSTDRNTQKVFRDDKRKEFARRRDEIMRMPNSPEKNKLAKELLIEENRFQL